MLAVPRLCHTRASSSVQHSDGQRVWSTGATEALSILLSILLSICSRRLRNRGLSPRQVARAAFSKFLVVRPIGCCQLRSVPLQPVLPPSSISGHGECRQRSPRAARRQRRARTGTTGRGRFSAVPARNARSRGGRDRSTTRPSGNSRRTSRYALRPHSARPRGGPALAAGKRSGVAPAVPCGPVYLLVTSGRAGVGAGDREGGGGATRPSTRHTKSRFFGWIGEIRMLRDRHSLPAGPSHLCR